MGSKRIVGAACIAREPTQEQSKGIAHVIIIVGATSLPEELSARGVCVHTARQSSMKPQM